MLKCEKTIHASRTSVILILPDTGSCGQFSCQERIVFIFLPVLAFMETYPRPVGFWTHFPFLQKVAMVPRQQLRTDEPPVASCRDFVRDGLRNIFSLDFIGIMEVTLNCATRFK